MVSVEGDDAKRLERIANERGKQPGEVAPIIGSTAERWNPRIAAMAIAD